MNSGLDKAKQQLASARSERETEEARINVEAHEAMLEAVSLQYLVTAMCGWGRLWFLSILSEYLIVTIICGYYILRIFAIWKKSQN